MGPKPPIKRQAVSDGRMANHDDLQIEPPNLVLLHRSERAFQDVVVHAREGERDKLVGMGEDDDQQQNEWHAKDKEHFSKQTQNGKI